MTISSENSKEAHETFPKFIGLYEIHDLLGYGGMGIVYKGFHSHLKRNVAIKVIREARSTLPGSIKRFYQEIEAVGKLRHPNIVQAFDAGEIDGNPYLVMELLEGMDLARFVANEGAMQPSKACNIILQAAKGLEHAHRTGLVHRDIKPSNLWLTPDGTVKILDLGLSRLLEKDESELQNHPYQTESILVAGTPDFIAPEQVGNFKEGDKRSDIYSLGCTFYFLLTGKPPFSNETHPRFIDKIAAHAKEPLPPLRRSRRDVPQKIETLIRHMTAKKPEHRPQHAAGVVEKLETFSHDSFFVTKMKPLVAILSGLLVLLLLAALMITSRFFSAEENKTASASTPHETETLIEETPPQEAPPEDAAKPLFFPINPGYPTLEQITSGVPLPVFRVTIDVNEQGEGYLRYEKGVDLPVPEVSITGTPFTLSSLPKAKAYRQNDGQTRLLFNLKDTDPFDTWKRSGWWGLRNVTVDETRNSMLFHQHDEEYATLDFAKKHRFPIRLTCDFLDGFFGYPTCDLRWVSENGQHHMLRCYIVRNHETSLRYMNFVSYGTDERPVQWDRLHPLIDSDSYTLEEPIHKSFRIPSESLSEVKEANFRIYFHSDNNLDLLHLDVRLPLVLNRGFELASDENKNQISTMLTSSPAYRAGLEPGDVILSVNDKETEHIEQALDALQVGEPIRLLVKRDDEEIEISYMAE